ncbi:unnamed protein product [Symbiodinium sp. KB8]|nr:unnamed protein product [Symbiodinium sp. KB8]
MLDPAKLCEELRERAHHREEEVREAVTAKEAAQAELRRCKEELEAARIELTRQRSEDLPKPAVEAKADCLRRSLMASGGLRKALDATDAEGRVSRCLELARANKLPLADTAASHMAEMCPDAGVEELWRDFLSWAEAGGAQGLDQVMLGSMGYLYDTRIAFVAKDDGPVRGLVAKREDAQRFGELLVSLDPDFARQGWHSPSEASEAELQQYHIAYASEELLNAFHELPVVARTRAWHQSLAEDWRKEAENWQQQAEQIGPTALTFDDFFWACTVVKTRVYLPPPTYCFMPLADMMNTEPEPNMDVYDSLEVDAPGRTEYYGILLRDGCRVSAGQELTQAYRPVDNSERLFRGGFLLKDNPVAVPRLAINVPASEVSPGSPLELSLRRLVAEHATAPEQVGETDEWCDADGGKVPSQCHVRVEHPHLFAGDLEFVHRGVHAARHGVSYPGEITAARMRALSARVPWQTLRPLVRRHGSLADHRTLREFEDLRHHLVSEGADLDPELLVVRESSDGFGVFAGRAIQKGEVVASVPRRLVLEVPFAVQPRPAEALPFAAAAGGHGQWYDVMGFPAGRAAVTKAAERLIEEYHAGHNSPFKAYCAALPPPSVLPPPLHPLRRRWPLELLKASPMVERLYMEARSLNRECLEALAKIPDCSLELRCWALAAVITRNFALKGPTAGVSSLGLLPFIDLFNHQSSEGGKIPFTCSYQERHGCVVMVADRGIAKGEELTFVYAAAPDAALLIQYGIPPAASNFHNVAGIQIHSDVLGAEVRNVVRDWGWTDLTKPLLFTLPGDLGRDAPLWQLAALVAQPNLDRPHVPPPKQQTRRRGHRKRDHAPNHDGATLAVLVAWLEAALSRTPSRWQRCAPSEDSDLFAAVAVIAEREAEILEECLLETRRRLLAAELLLESFEAARRS